ncbi:hypothetical protein [Terricaulis sp.]|uniref:hypothetical protein n=1 Tax=Terricaulis sp. TaxID=2768686 RepID=UPI00378316C5
MTRSASGHEKRTPWREIVSVRLYADPARDRPWRYVFELQPLHKRKITIDNAHAVGRGDYEDRSASYTPFVRAALKQLAAENPKARALMAETQKRYFFLMLFGILAMGALALALAALPTPPAMAEWAPLAKFALVLALLPVFWAGILRVIPRGVPLDQIPARALPPEGGAAETAATS